MRNLYLTTTLPYVNADPHIGFALELVQADALARSWLNRGDTVFFNTGTDEHGQKIFEAAKRSDKDVQEYVDYYANEFRKLKEELGVSDELKFIRTTDEHHIQAAQEMWKRCADKGDIYEKEFEGLYCVGCEKYLTQKEIIDGKCHIHMVEPQPLKEKNYFFKLSNYQEKLLEYLDSPNVIVPDWRRVEAINFIKEGLEDFSISREKKRLSWGVPVPGDDSQVMYVWFDALTNYISTLGWPDDGKGDFKKFWEEGYTLQMAGKDQVRFQSIMWQAMLMSADIKNTDQIFYHGFINSGGQKMSKSLGNVISPYELVKKYGTEATRYLLLRHVHATEDTDVTWERLDEWYTAGLVNGIGNLVARIMKLSEIYNVSRPDNVDVPAPSSTLDFEFNVYINSIWNHVQQLDEHMQKEEPFKRIKTDESAGMEIIRSLKGGLIDIAHALAPIMPE
ncbi:methionine--tRNA ligase, partial [Patescibacteria group bacterium]